MRDSQVRGDSCAGATCERCRQDQSFLRSTTRPTKQLGGTPIRIVDLFAGCGGMSIGLEEAFRRAGRPMEVALSMDIDATAMSVYKLNLPSDNVQVGDVAEVFDGEIGESPTSGEAELSQRVLPVDVLVGGPPCQGHSNLNNRTRRRDPRNALYLRMARAAEVLRPQVVIIENVPAVQWDEAGVVSSTCRSLTCAGYEIASRILDLSHVGVPQRRRRHVLLASRVPALNPASVLDTVGASPANHPARTVRWAIQDLVSVRNETVSDTASRISERNSQRIAFLFDKNLYDLPNRKRPRCHRDGRHSYVSVYGRLHWDSPAQTITTGFGSMGQGRYVHPSRRRTLTPHEAARLQSFPDWFEFGKDTKRTILSTLIGNAVPPLLMVALGTEILGLLSQSAASTKSRRLA